MGNSGIEVLVLNNKKAILNTILDRSEAHFIMVGLPGFACTLVRPFKSDTSGKVANLELSFFSRSLRMKIINLDLVSMP